MVSSGVQSENATDSTGYYSITHLDPGQCTVQVEAKGSKRFVQEYVTLLRDSTAGIGPKPHLGEGGVRQEAGKHK